MLRNRLFKAVEQLGPSPITILEIGCGSANEYEGFVATGIAQNLIYTGIDISERNIDNARRRYPEVDFKVGDILTDDFDERSYDVVLMKDVLEHMSLQACHFCLDRAISISRFIVLIAFFNEDAMATEHTIQPLRLYHWNRYSRCRLLEHLSSPRLQIEIDEVPESLLKEYPNRSVWQVSVANRAS